LMVLNAIYGNKKCAQLSLHAFFLKLIF